MSADYSRGIEVLKELAIVAGLGLACFMAHGQNSPEWLPLAESNTDKWEGHAGTRTRTTTRAGDEVVVAEGRVTNRLAHTIAFEKYYAKVDDCRTGSGKLVTLDMAGNYKFETDFVLHGGNVASSLAEMLCYAVSEADKKSL